LPRGPCLFARIAGREPKPTPHHPKLAHALRGAPKAANGTVHAASAVALRAMAGQAALSFDKLRMAPSTSSGWPLRQAQDGPFDKLRMAPSTSFLRLAVLASFDSLCSLPSTRCARSGHGRTRQDTAGHGRTRKDTEGCPAQDRGAPKAANGTELGTALLRKTVAPRGVEWSPRQGGGCGPGRTVEADRPRGGILGMWSFVHWFATPSGVEAAQRLGCPPPPLTGWRNGGGAFPG
jgi:hypothetical protein